MGVSLRIFVFLFKNIKISFYIVNFLRFFSYYVIMPVCYLTFLTFKRQRYIAYLSMKVECRPVEESLKF